MVLARLMELEISILGIIFSFSNDWKLSLIIFLVLFVELILGAWDRLDFGIWFFSLKYDINRVMEYFNKKIIFREVDEFEFKKLGDKSDD